MTSLRAKLAPLLPAVMLAASGCIYNVQPAPAPDIKPLTASLPLSVAVVEANDGGRGRGLPSSSDALVTALLRTGMFRDVRPSGTGGGADVVVQLSGKQDRTMKAFFPWFLPLCDPLIIGCLPFYSITEKFTAEMQAQVGGGKVYSETGEAGLHCQGTLGCAPASQGDPDARKSAVENGAAKLAADFLKDAAFFRDMARSRQAAAYEASRNAPDAAPATDSVSSPEPGAAVPAAAPTPAAAPVNGKPWWQN